MYSNKKISKYLEYLFVFSVIVSGGTMYGVLDTLYNNFNDFTLRIICMAASLLLMCNCIVNKRIAISKSQAINFIGFIIFFGVYLLATRCNVNSCLEGLCIPFLLFYVLSLYYGAANFFRFFFDKYSTIIFFISCISVAVFCLVTLFHIYPGWDMEYYNNGYWYSGKNYFYLCFTNNWQAVSLSGLVIYKNIGIFMEAPGFATPLIFTLWWELFGRISLNKKRIFIIFMALLTSFSVKGIILGLLVIFLYVYFNVPDKKGFIKKYRWLFFVPIVMIFSFVSIEALSIKIADSADVFGSWAIRLSDVAAAISTWLNYPIFGCGFYNLTEIYKHYVYVRHTGTPTMGLFNILAFGGIYTFLWYFIGFYKFFKKSKNNCDKWLIRNLLIIIIALFCTSGIQYSYTIILLLAIGWSIDKRNFASVYINKQKI